MEIATKWRLFIMLCEVIQSSHDDDDIPFSCCSYAMYSVSTEIYLDYDDETLPEPEEICVTETAKSKHINKSNYGNS